MSGSNLTNAEFQDAVAEFRNVFLTSEELIFTDEELAGKSVDDLIALVKERAIDIYNKKEAILGEPLMRELERVMLLRVVDEYWMEHIDAMDDLKQGIRLRAYGQEDPVVAYKRQSFDMFDQMTLAIQDETVRRVYIAQVRRNRLERRPVAQACPGVPGRPGHGGSTADHRQGGSGGRERGGKAQAYAHRQGQEDRPQRALPLRFRPEVQELPRQERCHHLYAGRRRELNE